MGFVRRVWRIQNTYNWPVPLNLSGDVVTFKTLGNGGGGGGITASTGRAGGASGGCFVQASIAVTPGEVLTLVIPDFTVGQTDGGDVEVWRGGVGGTCLVRAKGGKKGGNASGGGNGTAGIADTTGCIGDVVFAGGNGAAGNTSPSHSGGGGGGAWEQAGNSASNAGSGSAGASIVTPPFSEVFGGQGGSPQPSNSPGGSGQQFGSGGSGAFRSTSGTGAGGRGYIGFILAEYATATDVSPVNTVVACDAFQRADDTDIAGSSPDGCGTPGLAVGTWVKAFDTPESGDDLGIVGNKCVRTAGTAFEDYIVDGISDFPMPYHGSRVVMRFPTRDTITVPPSCTLLWEDAFDGSSGSLDGRVHSGGTLGTGTWERVDPYTSHEATLDGSGGVIQANGDLDHSGGAWYALRGLTGFPARTAYWLEIEIERLHDPAVAAGQPKTGAVGLIKYIPAGAPFALAPGSGNPANIAWLEYASRLNDSSQEVYGDFHGAWSEAGTIGHIILGSTLDPPGSYATPYPETTFLQMRETSTNNITLYVGDGSCESNNKAGGAIYNGIFSTPGFTSGDPGMLVDCGDSWRITAFRIWQYNPGTSGAAFEQSEVDVLARYDAATFTCVYGALEFNHFAPSQPTLTASLFLLTSSFSYLLATKFIAAAHDTAYVAEVTVEQDANGDDIAVLRLDGQVHLAYNLTQETSSLNVLAPISPTDKAEVTTGLPGMDVVDFLNPDVSVEILQWSALVFTETGPPCEGPPENPYPTDPPPDPDPPLVYLYQKRATADGTETWARTLAPIPTVQVGQVYGRSPSAQKLATDIRFRGPLRWHGVVAGVAQPPPPDTPLPPFYDPCEILDPENPDYFPPIGDVTPIPAAGNRYFGASALPPTLMGLLMNGSQRPLGFWTPGELAQAAARNGTFLGGIGGYQNFRTGGVYDPSKMDTFIEGIAASIGSSLLTYQAAGTFAGVTFLDDFKVPALWPPSGLSVSEVTRIAAKWLTVLPGIRLVLRIAPTRYVRIPGVAVYVAQWDGPMMIGKRLGDTILQSDYRGWRNRELLRAISYGPDVVVNIQPNWLHGGRDPGGVDVGDGWGGPVCMPDEVLDMTDAWYGDGGGGMSDRIWGSTGFRWDPARYFNSTTPSLASLPDAVATMHNGIMSLPAFP